MADGRALAGGADRDQAVGALGDLPVHERAEGRLVERAVLEGRDQGGERPPEFCLGCHGLPPNARFYGTACDETDFIPGLASRRKGRALPPSQPRFCRGVGANITGPATQLLVFCPHIQSNRPRGLSDRVICRRRKAVTPSARRAALRSTAAGDVADARRRSVGAGAAGLGQGSDAKTAADRPQRGAEDGAGEYRGGRAEACRQPRRCKTAAFGRQRQRPLWRRPRASMPRCPAGAQQAGRSGRGRRDVIDLAGRQGRAGERHRARAQAASRATRRRLQATISDPVARKLAEWLILRSDDNGATVERYRAFLAANPSWPSQTFLRRRIEAALWDDQRDDSAVWSWFENESPVSAKGRFALAKAMLGARRPRQCRAAGARSLAQRSDVGGHRERRARPVRRAAHRRATTRRGWTPCSTAASRRPPACAPPSGSAPAMSRSPRRGIAANKKAANCGRCSRRCRANCTAIPAISSQRSSCCAARRNSPKPRS